MQSTLLGERFNGLNNGFSSVCEIPISGRKPSLNFLDAGSIAIKPERLRVASYCRVSTLSDMQEDSLENQIIHYTNYIRANPNWQFSGVFSDRGKSGTKIANRTGFKNLIRHALAGKIDLIICKSISRFARNVTDTLDTVRLLNENGVRVIFERENINTGDMQSEFILTMLSATAQEESRSVSDNVTWAVTKRFERGEPIFVRMMGYAKVDNKPWTIVEEEAEIVREAFENCLNGNRPSQIAKIFIRKGYLKANGRKDWSSLAIRDILKNEKYTGEVICQKTYTTDYLSHHRVVNDGTRSQYLLRNHHEPIVDRDKFDRVQQILSIRSKKVEKGKRKTYPLSGRLVCSECGGNLQRYINRGKVTWRCGNHIKSSKICSLVGIGEESIQKALNKAFSERYKIDESAQGKLKVVRIMKELQNAVLEREIEQNQLRLELERSLFAESNAIINSEDVSESTRKRIAIEEEIARKELWWILFDEDDEYRKEALEELYNIKNSALPTKELKININDIKFMRAWVAFIKVLSPDAISITWLSGEETEIEIERS